EDRRRVRDPLSLIFQEVREARKRDGGLGSYGGTVRHVSLSTPTQGCRIPLWPRSEDFGGGPNAYFRIAKIHHIHFPLLEPEVHVHLAVHGGRDGEILAGPLRIAAAVELAQAEVAMRDQRAHAVRLGERKCLQVARYPALEIEPVGMTCNVAEQSQRVRGEAGLVLRGFERTIAQSARLIDPPEQQTCVAHRVIRPAAMADDAPRRLALEQLFSLLDPTQRFPRLTDLRQRPGRGGYRPWKMDGNISGPEHRDPMLDP